MPCRTSGELANALRPRYFSVSGAAKTSVKGSVAATGNLLHHRDY
jgi:hypothetical protein